MQKEGNEPNAQDQRDFVKKLFQGKTLFDERAILLRFLTKGLSLQKSNSFFERF